MSRHQIIYVPLHNTPSVYADTFQFKSGILTATTTLVCALEMDLQEDYALILLDCLSASLEVNTACLELRNKFTKPILVLVADSDEASLVALYALGIDECIVRSAGINLVAAKVHSWLRWSSDLDVPSSTNNPGRSVPTSRHEERDPSALRHN